MKTLTLKLGPKVNLNEWRTDTFKLDIELQADKTDEQSKEVLAKAHTASSTEALNMNPK